MRAEHTEHTHFFKIKFHTLLLFKFLLISNTRERLRKIGTRSVTCNFQGSSIFSHYKCELVIMWASRIDSKGNNWVELDN